jgi:hypothetical protein
MLVRAMAHRELRRERAARGPDVGPHRRAPGASRDSAARPAHGPACAAGRLSLTGLSPARQDPDSTGLPRTETHTFWFLKDVCFVFTIITKRQLGSSACQAGSMPWRGGSPALALVAAVAASVFAVCHAAMRPCHRARAREFFA